MLGVNSEETVISQCACIGLETGLTQRDKRSDQCGAQVNQT